MQTVLWTLTTKTVLYRTLLASTEFLVTLNLAKEFVVSFLAVCSFRILYYITTLTQLNAFLQLTDGNILYLYALTSCHQRNLFNAESKKLDASFFYR